jgi:hypothetical protein
MQAFGILTEGGTVMVKPLALFVLATLATVALAVAAPAGLTRTVDLDAPGALAALEQSNPVHHEKVLKIVDGVIRQPDTKVARWITVNFNGRDVEYAPIVMTSHPPKRRLSFALDDTRYVTVVTLTNVRGEIRPAR